MKIIIPLFTSLFLATMTFAQEESASPAESTAPTTEEKASATVETTPEAGKTESAAPAQKKEEPMAAAPAAKTAAPKKETTAPGAGASTTTAKPAAAATTTKPMTGSKMSVSDMENAWEAAVAKHDYATLDAFVAPDFVGVSSKNKFIGRSDVTGEAKRDKDTYKSAKNEKLNVKMYGPNVTVVTGRAREVGTGKDGKAFDRTFLFTDTWMNRGGKWQCVASHVSKIKG
jgi:ketosteroid isomerase-like protein